ncbi:MAG: flagellar basal-body rod protein FlgF [Desulfuromonas sp.]|uniref:flagellar hook-basal body protein n=1 Tax=Desulfuromonas sp. TaxID=892 RepID=UPI000CC3D951|nr:flagellar hook basal-body protein [Desulfuromonas sp.]PLX84477.1 MAG: flagellar basal-body rod protein FlgF [Desulfuromonas sp.]
MSSGVYGVLSGAKARMQMLDTISDNLSNAQTVGFKKGQAVFEARLEAARSGLAARGVDYARIEEGFTDFTQGALSRTNVPLHLAIDGEGFFKVQDAGGSVFYTRQGNLRLDTGGGLLTADGLQMLDDEGRPIALPRPDVEIDEEGNVFLDDGEMKKIPLYTFDDLSILKRQGGGMFVADPAAVEQRVAEPRIYRGQLEDANINLMQEMGQMVDSMRVFEACQKMLKTYHDLAGKANELGIVA